MAGAYDAAEFIGSSYDPAAPLFKNYTDFPPIFIREVEEGRTNLLMKVLKMLVMKIAYQAPEIEIEDLPSSQAVLIGSYLSKRVRECQGHKHMEKALWDAVVSGLGWVFVGTRGGKPVIEYSDVNETFWDMQSPTLEQGEFVGRMVRGPKWKIAMNYKGIEPHIGKNSSDETPICLTEYYDVDSGPNGAWCAFYEGDLVFEADNPFYPIIPGKPLTLFETPNVKLPTGIAEQLVPAFKAICEAERSERETVKRMVPFYESKEGTMSDEDKAAFDEGEIGAVIETADGNSVIQKGGGEVPSTLLNWIQSQKRELVEAGGINPYELGGTVEDVQFAAETNAIQGSAGLTTATIAKKNVEFWVGVLKDMLTLGQHDINDFSCIVDNAQLQFDASDPIGAYLEPDANIVIRENTMQFISKREKEAEALNKLTVAASYGQLFPQGPPKAYEAWLRASGEKDIRSWMEQPQAPAMTAQMPVSQEAMAANQ